MVVHVEGHGVRGIRELDRGADAPVEQEVAGPALLVLVGAEDLAGLCLTGVFLARRRGR